MAIILLNAVTIGVETMVAHDSRAHQALSLLDRMALGVFLVEIALKLIAVGPLRWSAGCFSDCVCFVCHAAISQLSSSCSTSFGVR